MFIDFNKLYFKYVVIFIIFIVLSIYFSTNTYIDTSSECLVLNRAMLISATGLDGLHSYCGFLINQYQSPSSFYVYDSNCGWHGIIYGIITNLFNFSICKYIVASMLSLCLCLFLNWILIEFGFFPAIMVFLSIFFNNELYKFGNSPHQSLFLFILPLIVSLYVLKYEEKEGTDLITKKFIHWNIWIFLIILIKCLFMFEGVSILILNSLIPIIYYSIKNKWNKRKFLKYIIIITLSGVTAFVLSIVIHIIQLCIFHKSIFLALEKISFDIARRIGVGEYTNYNNFGNDQDFSSFVNASKLYVVCEYLNNKTVILNNKSINDILKLLFYFLIAFPIIKLSSIKQQTKEKYVALLVLLLFAILTSISWYIVGSPHAAEHPHLISSYLSLPATLVIIAFISYTIVLIFNISIEIIKKLFHNITKIKY